MFWGCFFHDFFILQEKRESLKTIVFVVPEGLSRLSEDRKINENSMKNQSKFEAQLGVRLGIDFSRILFDFGSLVGTQDGIKIDKRRESKVNEILKVFGSRSEAAGVWFQVANRPLILQSQRFPFRCSFRSQFGRRPGWDFGGFLEGSGWMLKRFWLPFSKFFTIDFATFLHHFS